MAQRFKADELAVVRDFMRQAKEVFQRQVTAAVMADDRAPRQDPGGARRR